MSTDLESSIFSECTFHYAESHEDYTEVKWKILKNGGTLVSFADLAAFRLAHVPCTEKEEYYDVSLLDDSISCGSLVDASDYLIASATGYAWISSQRKYAALTSKQPADRNHTVASDRGDGEYREPEPSTRKVNGNHPITRFHDPSIMRGRNFYTMDDMMRILDYILGNQGTNNSPNGQNLWEGAFHAKLIPGRSDQAMRDQWIKKIRPRYEEYMSQYREWKASGKSWRDSYVR